ncbi:hypothetical protein FB45DRAFT_934261 [Roridomyces roridus]|uniref:Uncharacterized protein n=1 Tax=Roridomyces roridus TaxID=1738132 RepID=A0AAD7BBZ8_9AGAR|nr:hypothetical protein FB45DRAFT_934261 [Roridomyces roridus]
MNPFKLLLCTFLSVLVAGMSVADRAIDSMSLVRRQATLGFASSKWIWTTNTAANQAHAFRKDFTPPFGKSLIAAEVIVAAVNQLTFWVNGEILGSTGVQAWAGRFCVDLDPSFNVFAVNASSTNTNGAFIATILLTFSDGTTDTLVSDSSWLSNGNSVPDGFAEQSLDDTTWVPATVRATYDESGTPYFTPQIPTNPPTLSFPSARWIWTDVLSSTGTVPKSTRVFRRTWAPPTGGEPASADIIITAENEYTLYVNGFEVGSGTNWKVAGHYTVNFAPGTRVILVAVSASNLATSAAGVLMEMEVNMLPGGRNNCTAGVYGYTDALWRSTLDVIPDGWQLPGFDDSTWPLVVDEGSYPDASPWGSSVSIAAPSPPVNAF